jgi:signal transduction histidine kinase/HAMP domain-containing protein
MTGKGTPVLARLRVGTKLMLLVLVPVCALLAFTILAARSDWRHASDLRRFDAAAGLSYATARVADTIGSERLETVLSLLRRDARTAATLASARPQVDDALRQATERVATSRGTPDASETIDAARRQVQALRRQAATGALSAQQAGESYSLIVDNLQGTIERLDAGPPTVDSGRATGAYFAILRATEAARRERLDVVQLLAAPRGGQAPVSDPWATVEATELEAFRRNATNRLIGELDALLFQPASIRVQEVRDRITANPDTGLRGIPLSQWLSSSSARIAALRQLEGHAGDELATTVATDLGAAQANAIRDIALSLVVVVLVTELGLLLRRSITRPLQRVSAGARALSSGDLTFDTGYSGRDEIGDVAAALGQLRVVAESLAQEIRSMDAAIRESRLDHRADVAAFSGTWSQLLAGMNDTMAAFAGLHNQEAALRRVATLVARGVPPEEIFNAVVTETRELLGADVAGLIRYDTDGATMIATASEPEVTIPVGTRFTLDGESVTSLVRRTGRPASIATYENASGMVAELMRGQGICASVGAPIIVEGRAWGMIAAAWTQTQPVSPNTEDRVAQFTELVATAIANADSSEQLSASRARLVAAADEARRRIERDLHDGLQQRLVSLGLDLRNVEATIPEEFPELRSRLERVNQGLTGASDELRAVSRGIHPAILSVGGLGPALRALARRAPLPVELELDEGDRMPKRLAVPIYYVVSEALTNVAKHAQATSVQVKLKAEDSFAELEIRDDGLGGADPERGSGLVGLADRVEALGGTIEITSPPGRGTAVVVTLPIAPDREAQPTASSPQRGEIHD